MAAKRLSERTISRIHDGALVAGAAACGGSVTLMLTSALRNVPLSSGARAVTAAVGMAGLLGTSFAMRRDRTAGQAQAAIEAAHATECPTRSSFLTAGAAVLRQPNSGDAFALLIIDAGGLLPTVDDDRLVERWSAAVSLQLRTVLRPTDVIGRLSGDQFSVLLRRSGPQPGDALSIAERLVEQIHYRFDLEGIPGTEAVVGVALVEDTAVDIGTLLQRADVAVRTAKRHERSISIYGIDPNATDDETAEVNRLRHAIENGELTVHYQPTFEIATGLPVSMEALVRWKQPDGRLVPPLEFIPRAEQNGLIHLLTHTVLDETLRQCRLWLNRGWNVPVAVNVSAVCLHDAEFADLVQAELARHDIPAHMLTFELDQAAVTADGSRVGSQLGFLRYLGVRIALDDVGLGSSTVESLRTLPVDEIKIDRSLVTTMMRNAKDTATVREIIELGRQLAVRVVAEGAEDNATCDLLMDMGCEYGQGFNWMRPMPAEELDGFLGIAMDRIARRAAAAENVSAVTHQPS